MTDHILNISDEEIVLKPDEQPLTDTDLDVLSGMMIIFLHSAERVIELMEREYERRYRASKHYKILCQQYGKPYVDNLLKEKVRNILRGDERNKLGKILKSAKEFHLHMESLNKSGRQSHKEGITEVATFDAIIHDTNFLCYIYALMANCLTDEDEIKILSTVKVLAKGDRVTDRVLERLKPKYA